MELADDSGRDLRRSPRMEQLVLRAFPGRLGVQSATERLDHPLSAEEAAGADPGDVDALLRELAAARVVDARDLEEGDAVAAQLRVATSGLDQAREQLRAQHGELDGDRLGEAQRVGGSVGLDQRRRVDLGEAEPDQRVLDPSPEALLAA